MIERRKLPRVNKDCHISIFLDTEQTILLTMTLIERGIYATLRAIYCLDREGIKNNLKRYSLCFAHTKEEQAEVDNIYYEFFDPNSEIDYCLGMQNQNSISGKLGAEKRWENTRKKTQTL